MSECIGPGCDHPDCTHSDPKPFDPQAIASYRAMAEGLRPAQYGTSMHFPYCADGRCTGCLPPAEAPIAGDQVRVAVEVEAPHPKVEALNRAQRRAMGHRGPLHPRRR